MFLFFLFIFPLLIIGEASINEDLLSLERESVSFGHLASALSVLSSIYSQQVADVVMSQCFNPAFRIQHSSLYLYVCKFLPQ